MNLTDINLTVERLFLAFFKLRSFRLKLLPCQGCYLAFYFVLYAVGTQLYSTYYLQINVNEFSRNKFNSGKAFLGVLQTAKFSLKTPSMSRVIFGFLFRVVRHRNSTLFNITFNIDLGTTRLRFGSGFTLGLINSVVKKVVNISILWIRCYWPLTFGTFHMLIVRVLIFQNLLAKKNPLSCVI